VPGPKGDPGATGPTGPKGDPGAAGSAVRTVTTATTTSLAPAATNSTTAITIAKTFTVLNIQTSRPARVRLYATAAARTADLSRPTGTDPASDAGVLLEYITTDTAVHGLSPMPDGASMEATPTANIPMTVTNNDTVTGTVTVTLTTLVLEP
jgi:hypothetical protein